jgi:hypothetical protein
MARQAQWRRGAMASWPAGDGTGQRREKVRDLSANSKK